MAPRLDKIPVLTPDNNCQAGLLIPYGQALLYGKTPMSPF